MTTVRSGVFPPLEREADAIIFASTREQTSQAAKSDILTPWKQQDRLSREVYSRSGTVDAAIRSGMYHRAANRAKPYLNSRDGVAPAQRMESIAPHSVYIPDEGSYYDGSGEWD
jgi:hypothetical protein